MSAENFFKVSLKEPVCIEGLDEDALRALVDALVIKVADKNFGGFVLSTKGVQVKFNFPDGNFESVTARVNGQEIVLFGGVGSTSLGLFKGVPSATNPGEGWKIEQELTEKYLNQPPTQANWEIFYASRKAVLNSFT